MNVNTNNEEPIHNIIQNNNIPSSLYGHRFRELLKLFYLFILDAIAVIND